MHPWTPNRPTHRPTSSSETGHRPELDADRLSAALGIIGFGMSWVNSATVALSEQFRQRPNL